MNDLFSQLQELLLQCDESIEFYIKRDPKGLAVAFVPRLEKPTFVAVPEHIDKGRAALAIPLYMQGTAAQLDAEFALRLQGYATERRSLLDTVDFAVREIREANKTVRSKTGSKGTTQAKTGDAAPATVSTAKEDSAESPPEEDDAEKPTDAPTKPPTNDDMSQPLSLF